VSEKKEGCSATRRVRLWWSRGDVERRWEEESVMKGLMEGLRKEVWWLRPSSDVTVRCSNGVEGGGGTVMVMVMVKVLFLV